MTALFELLRPELQMVHLRLERETRLQKQGLPAVTMPVLNPLDEDFLPALVLLSAHTQGYSGSRALSLAAVFQFIFLASLMHSDVKDEVAVQTLVGDYFYARFLDLLCRDGNLQFLVPLSRLICQIHLDAAGRHEKSVSADGSHLREYLATMATYLGSQLGKVEPQKVEVWKEIGMFLGKLWNGQPVKVKAGQAIEKLAPKAVKDLLVELVFHLSEKLPAKQVMAL